MLISPCGICRGRNLRNGEGFTLVELSIVLGILSLILALELPAISRLLSFQHDPYQDLRLWFELACERTLFRNEPFLVEVDPRQRQFRLVRPLVREGGEIEWEELSDPFLPTVIKLPEEVRILDLELLSGTKLSDVRTLIKILPSGWVDPFTLHLTDDKNQDRTGFMNPFTCELAWEEGYKERLMEGR